MSMTGAEFIDSGRPTKSNIAGKSQLELQKYAIMKEHAFELSERLRKEEKAHYKEIIASKDKIIAAYKKQMTLVLSAFTSKKYAIDPAQIDYEEECKKKGIEHKLLFDEAREFFDVRGYEIEEKKAPAKRGSKKTADTLKSDSPPASPAKKPTIKRGAAKKPATTTATASKSTSKTKKSTAKTERKEAVDEVEQKKTTKKTTKKTPPPPQPVEDDKDDADEETAEEEPADHIDDIPTEVETEEEEAAI